MAKVASKKKLQFWGTGRRKKAVARVRLIQAVLVISLSTNVALTITVILN